MDAAEARAGSETILPPPLDTLGAVLTRRAERFKPVKPSARRDAGVLIPFFQRAGRLHLIFFRRSGRVPTHRGQVAFPGGAGEPEDADLLATALREAREELGIDPSRVRLLGRLQPFDTFASNFIVHPFCGFIEGADAHFGVVDPFEVAEVLEVPFDALSDPDNRHRGLVPGFRHIPYPLPYYDIDGTVIWGVTGAIVAELLEAMEEAYAATSG